MKSLRDQEAHRIQFDVPIPTTIQALSELGEEQFYRLPARRVDATLTWHYK